MQASARLCVYTHTHTPLWKPCDSQQAAGGEEPSSSTCLPQGEAVLDDSSAPRPDPRSLLSSGRLEQARANSLGGDPLFRPCWVRPPRAGSQNFNIGRSSQVVLHKRTRSPVIIAESSLTILAPNTAFHNTLPLHTSMQGGGRDISFGVGCVTVPGAREVPSLTGHCSLWAARLLLAQRKSKHLLHSKIWGSKHGNDPSTEETVATD